MTDKVNICLVFNDKMSTDSDAGADWIFLYSHNGGVDALCKLQESFKKSGKVWNDPVYLARVLFNALTREAASDLYGYGLSPYMCDNSDCNEVIYIVLSKQYVQIGEDPSEEARLSYPEFIDIPKASLYSLLRGELTAADYKLAKDAVSKNKRPSVAPRGF